VRRILAVVIVFASLGWSASATAQFRIVNYNVNNSDPAAFGPRAGMDAVFRGMNASAKGGFARAIDVLILEEAESVATTGTAYAALLNTVTAGTSYLRSTVDAGSTGSGRPIAIYNSSSVSLIAEKKIGSTSGAASQPRQTMRYQFRPIGYDATADFYVYASHYKASTGAANEAERNVEARAIRVDADAIGQGASIIYAGDLNFYTSSESGFQTLTGTGNGQAFDPISRVGSWSGSTTYKDVHTQSPATTAVFNGQVTGGMDDRFDFQLITDEVRDGGGFDYIAGSYWAFGNTATHAINQAISTGSAATLAARIPGYTTTQAQTVLTSLTQVTDHLPVLADYQLPAKMTATLAALPARVIRGGTVSATLTVANSAPVAVAAGADQLDYAYTAAGAVAASGTGSDAALGASNIHMITLSTTSVGLRSGTVGVIASSPQTMSPTFSGTISTSIFDHAIGSFASAATTTSLTIDFGTLIRGGAPGSSSFTLFNRPASSGTAWTAKLDLDGVSSTAPAGVFSTTLAPLANLASGSSRGYAASMASGTAGTFSGTYTLALSDEDLPGAVFQQLSLAVRGSVIPPATGDTNFDAFVDLIDAGNVLAARRYDTGELATWSEGDFNADRVVDILDITDLLAADLYDQGDYRPLVAGLGQLGAVAAVPEPSTLVIVSAALAVVAVLGSRRVPQRVRPGADASSPPARPTGRTAPA
jgi:hypothetical protein